ncbi:beta strand repeat-containing protein [Azospira restricta]|uniref:Filamentous hemagglutinin N-terminal domain-containing protein n=1 Tax=Azospira restricta TaxID=404405 RepID=A0A974SPY6_9RHOO|nr:filamentous hemagglutinin N-terminal domain-containing protein [Azospira restricta]QRJ64316.1 filamentous hemagglutinin N-terminal domain-containing protein [Azospira restricta]
MARNEPGRWPLKLICAALAACFAQGAAALPSGGNVASGNAAFAQNGNTLTVTNSNRAIINWGSFSIGRGETVVFNQGTSSSVLNRVVGVSVDGRLVIAPSEILGVLQSPGKVFLINPAGTLIGAGAVIDVGGFVASSLMLSDADFLANRLNFTEVAGAGDVNNFGTIKSTSGGSVYLIAPNVANHGIMQAPNGEVVLAAGRSVELIDSGTPGVKVAVSAGGEALNVGQLLAESGRIGMVGAIVRQQGTASTASLVREGGRIFLKATQSAELATGSTTRADGTQGGSITVDGGGLTTVAGSISATGNTSGGGRVELLGDRVGLFAGADIDASGATGGGTVLVGGDYQGSNAEVRNAQISYLDGAATIRADALQSGDGGKVIVWADDTTRAYGTISARGGAKGGDGGFVEVSAKGHLDYRGLTDTRAPNGKAGTLLLDPNDITIDNSAGESINGTWNPPGSPSPTDYAFTSSGGASSNIHWSTIVGQLALGNVALSTSGPGSANGDITFASNMYSYSSTNALTFLAHRNITFNGGGIINSAAGDIGLVAGWNGSFAAPAATGTAGSVWLKNSYIQTQGQLKILARNDIKLDATAAGGSALLSSAGGAQWIEAGGSVLLHGGIGGQAIIDYNGGGLQTVKATNIEVKADPNTSAASSNYWARIRSQASQTIEATGTITVAGGGSAAFGGRDNYAEIAAWGTQSVKANILTLTGGAGTGGDGYNNFAKIAQESSSGSQKITITGGGQLNLQGGTGTGTLGYAPAGCGGCPSSNNHASIWNSGSGGQEIDFVAGGSLQLTGGSNGTNNFAAIEHNNSAGQQKIWSSTANNPAITLAGGSSGGTTVVVAGNDYQLSNDASIFAKGSQLVKGANIQLSGGSGTATGAFIEADGAQQVVATGNVTLTGGNNSLENEASIGSETSQLISITGALSLTGGGGGASPAGAAMITAPTQDITVGGSATLTAGNSNATGDYGMGAGAVIGWDASSDIFLDVTGALSMNGSNATNQAMIGAATGSAAVEIRASAITTTANSAIGNWDGSMGGSVKLTATSGAISLPANSTLRTASLTASAGSSISFLGNDYVDFVTLTAGGPVSYHTANGNTTHITTINATGAIDVVGDIGSTSIALGTLTTTGTSNISVSAQGQILDDNGSGTVNLTTGAGNIALTSQVGTPVAGTLAISADVATSGQVTANVNGGPYGSIVIRDVGTTAVNYAGLTASAATSEGNVSYFRYGNLDIGGGTTLMLTPKTGAGAAIGASGDIQVSASLSMSGAKDLLAAGGDLTFAGGTLTMSGDGTLVAGGNLSVTGGNVSLQGTNNAVLAGGLLSIAAGRTITAGMGTLGVAASSIDVAGTLSGFSDTFVYTPGTLAINGGSLLSTAGNLYFIAEGPMSVTGSVSAAQGIVGKALGGLTLGAAAGGSGTISANGGVLDLVVGGPGIAMYNGSYLNSTDATQPYGGLITLFFPGLSAGGSLIDGAASFAGGYKVGGALTDLGQGLDVTYGILSNPVSDAIIAATLSTSTSAGDTSQTTNSATLVAATTTTSSTTTSTTETTQTIGGTGDTFGGTTSGDGTTSSGDGASSTAQGTSTSGSKQEDRNAKKKPAQCSA